MGRSERSYRSKVKQEERLWLRLAKEFEARVGSEPASDLKRL